MKSADADATANGDAVPTPIAAARRLAAGVREHADDIERGRRLPRELVQAFANAGLFRMCVPRQLGGAEVDAATMVQTIEAVSHADGSAGWCVMIGATSGVMAAYLPDAIAREIYGTDPHAVSGGVLASMGKATVTGDGYRVTGRWPFASGCEHCSWLMGGSVVIEHDKPRVLPNGAPDVRTMLFPAAAAEVIDTWTVSGLRGTGSHDIAVRDLYVPHDRSVSLTTERPRQSGPLYVFPVFGLLALGIAGVALGVARNALDALSELAGAKTPTGSRRRLAERAVIQMHVAQAEATLGAARAFLFETIDRAWQAAATQGEMTIQQRAQVRLAATHATVSSAAAVDLMYNAGGGTSVYATSPLQRCFRDIHVVTQHMMVAPATYELTGRILLGLETDPSTL